MKKQLIKLVAEIDSIVAEHCKSHGCIGCPKKTPDLKSCEAVIKLEKLNDLTMRLNKNARSKA